MVLSVSAKNIINIQFIIHFLNIDFSSITTKRYTERETDNAPLGKERDTSLDRRN